MRDLIERQAAINTNGLDEEIRCEMCKNQIRTDRGCDGNCQYDEILYEKIIQILNKRITPLPSAEPDIPNTNVDDTISRRAAIDALERNACSTQRAIEAVEALPSAQPNLQPTCNQLATDVISRQAAIDALMDEFKRVPTTAIRAKNRIDRLPSAQQEGWLEQNKAKILQAGMEGREIEFRIGGRLFAIREKAQ